MATEHKASSDKGKASQLSGATLPQQTHRPVTMFLIGFTRALKAETSGCLCSHIGCQITRPLAKRNVRSDS